MYSFSSTMVVTVMLVAVLFILVKDESAVNLTVEEGVSLVGPHCPGTVRLFCEGIRLTALGWMYNGSIEIEPTFSPDDTISTSTTAFFNIQLKNVSQSSDDRRFANFSSILTVNLSQLEQHNIMSISCGDPLTRESVPVDVQISAEIVPAIPKITKANGTRSLDMATITIGWKIEVNYLFICPGMIVIIIGLYIYIYIYI